MMSFIPASRVASIFEQAKSQGVPVDSLQTSGENLERLVLPEELEMIKKVLQYAEVVRDEILAGNGDLGVVVDCHR